MKEEADVTTPGSGFKPFMTSEQFANGLTAFILPVAIPSLLGIVTNLLNIRVFTRMGLHDSITISYLALSVSDLGIVVLLVCIAGVASVESVEMKASFSPLIDPRMLGWIFGRILQFFTILSTLFTCYLAVTKSMCVILPFRFKELFTPAKAVTTLCILSGICVVQLIIFTQIDVRWIKLVDNSTRAVLTFRESFKYYFVAYDIFSGPIMTLGSEVITTVCVGIMIYKLKKSVQFRLSTAHGSTAPHRNHRATLNRNEDNMVSDNSRTITATSISAGIDVTASVGLNVTAGVDRKETKKRSINSDVTAHERRVIQQVLLVVLIFILLKLPHIGIILLRRSEEKFFIAHSYRRTSILINFGKFTFDALNSFINIFVYYRYNTRYRQTLRQIFRLLRPGE